MHRYALGGATMRLPDRPRTLLARGGAVWMWPGIPLTLRKGAAIEPIDIAILRFWVTRLHGPEGLDIPLAAVIGRAAEHLVMGNEVAAQRALDTGGFDRLSVDGAALMRRVAMKLGIGVVDLPLRAGPMTWDGRVIESHLPLFELYGEAAVLLAKAWDESKHPRWQAGMRDGGQFRSADGSGNASLAEGRSSSDGYSGNDEPPLEEPPHAPQIEPPKARYALIKQIGRWMVQAVAAGADKTVKDFMFKLEMLEWITRLAYDRQLWANLDPPKTIQELQDAVSNPKPGYQIHHIVEQDAAERDGFPRSQIDAPDNLVLVPAMKHREITSWYMTPNKDFMGLSPREFLHGRSWEVRREVGLWALQDAKVLEP